MGNPGRAITEGHGRQNACSLGFLSGDTAVIPQVQTPDSDARRRARARDYGELLGRMGPEIARAVAQRMAEQLAWLAADGNAAPQEDHGAPPVGPPRVSECGPQLAGAQNRL